MPMGILSKLYVNTGIYSVPTWLLVDLVSDLVVTGAWNEAEGSTRREVQQVFEPTNMQLAITGKIRKDVTDAAYLVFRSNHILRAPIDVMELDGLRTVNGSDGFRFDAKVFGWDEDQGLQNVTFKDFALKPCISYNVPQIVLVAGGIPVFTPITN